MHKWRGIDGCPANVQISVLKHFKTKPKNTQKLNWMTTWNNSAFRSPSLICLHRMFAKPLTRRWSATCPNLTISGQLISDDNAHCSFWFQGFKVFRDYGEVGAVSNHSHLVTPTPKINHQRNRCVNPPSTFEEAHLRIINCITLGLLSILSKATDENLMIQ